MDCGVNAPDVKVEPAGCKPVSEDVCKSGFMAPSGNIEFPEDALDQCCKCPSGESCSYCENPDSCTEDEKKEFVTVKDCFSGSSTTSSSSENTTDQSGDGDGDGDDDVKKDLNFITENFNIIVMVGLGLSFIIAMMLFTRRSKSF